MPTTTITRESTAPETVHQPAPVELWLAKTQPYKAKHRGKPAVEDEPQNVRATSADAAYLVQ